MQLKFKQVYDILFFVKKQVFSGRTHVFSRFPKDQEV